MIPFSEYITEMANQHNEHYGQAYETATAMMMHTFAGLKVSKELQNAHNSATSKLPKHLAGKAIHRATKSANAYMKSLRANHGIMGKDIAEVHHTPKGVGHLTGKPSDRHANPHDIVIKTHRGDYHGASLKASSSNTLNNNTPKTADAAMAKSGITTNLAGVWTRGRKKAGLADASVADLKTKHNVKRHIEANHKTQQSSARHHTKAFNASTVKAQRKYVLHLLRSGKVKPDIPYDYVDAGKGVSTPHDRSPHVSATRGAKGFKAVRSGNLVKIHDHTGAHIVTLEHRTTHTGPFNSPQVNTKKGTLK